MAQVIGAGQSRGLKAIKKLLCPRNGTFSIRTSAEINGQLPLTLTWTYLIYKVATLVPSSQIF